MYVQMNVQQVHELRGFKGHSFQLQGIFHQGSKKFWSTWIQLDGLP